MSSSLTTGTRNTQPKIRGEALAAALIGLLALIGIILGGRISGMVTNATTIQPLADMTVYVFTTTGSQIRVSYTDAKGRLHCDRAPDGVVLSAAPPSSGLIDDLYDDVPCLAGDCTVNSGQLVPVTAAATTGDINFALPPGATGFVVRYDCYPVAE